MRSKRIEPQPPLNAHVEHSLLFDRVWWADSPDWNPWIVDPDGVSKQYPNVINSPIDMPGDDSVEAILEDGIWYWRCS